MVQLSLFDLLIPLGCAPANWRDLSPWRDDFRGTVRSAYPLYYQDERGVVWQKKRDVSGEYERWQG